jgi:hypothetical protein
VSLRQHDPICLRWRRMAPAVWVRPRQDKEERGRAEPHRSPWRKTGMLAASSAGGFAMPQAAALQLH